MVEQHNKIDRADVQPLIVGQDIYWAKVGLYFIPSALVIGAFLLGFYWYDLNSSMHILEEREWNRVELYNENLSMEIASVLSDLKYLASQHELQLFLDSNYSKNKGLEDDYLAFSKERGIYDQIRIIDRFGEERVRVNNDSGKPSIVPQDRLQNKANRYYFSDTLKLDRDDFFISPLDLNIENGEIEIPLKPMIRYGMPVYDSNGEKKGIILLNFLAARLLNVFQQLGQHSLSNTMLLNNDGFWMKGVTKDDEWGFMYQDRKMRTFPKRFPNEWDSIIKKGRGQLKTDNGLFSFMSIMPFGVHKSTNANQNDYYWIIVSQVPPEKIAEEVEGKRNFLILTSVLLAFLLLALSIVRTNHVIAQKLHQQSINQKNTALQDKQEKLQAAIDELFNTNEQLTKTVNEYEKALTEIKTLRGILPICSFCKEIRNDKGYWISIENYFEQHSGAEFSHSVCDKCMKEHYPEMDDDASSS